MIEAGATTKQEAGKRRDQHLNRRRETRGGRVDSRPVNLAGSGGSHDAAVAAWCPTANSGEVRTLGR
jgi:hypothetical protein